MDDMLISSKELYERGLSIRAVAKIKHENYETMRRCLHAMEAALRPPGRPRRGEVAVNGDGYVMVSQKLGPGRWATRAAHRVILEMCLDRPLASDEVVHHINGIRTDNRRDNLELMSKQDHLRLQREGRRKKE